MAIRVGIIGYGHIGRVQHRPSIEANAHFELAGVTGERTPDAAPDLVWFDSVEALLANSSIPVVVVATPPAVRYRLARAAILAGKHVLLEKPPAATLAEAEDLKALAAARGVSVLAAWHSRFNPSVEMAAKVMAEAPPVSVNVVWHENVDLYHPGQDWIWAPGGFGVFDAGINAISVLTRLLPFPILLEEATFTVRPGDSGPIAVRCSGASPDGLARIQMDLDWGVTVERRELMFELADGRSLHMPATGRQLFIDGARQPLDEQNREYLRIYDHFATLISERRSDMDLAPLQVVSDAYLISRRI